MKKFFLCTLIIFFLFCGTNALAVGFTDIPNDDVDIDISALFNLDVASVNDGGSVEFKITNNDSDGSVITGIYFDGIEGLLSWVPPVQTPIGDVNLVEDGKDTSDPSKANVPQGGEIDFDADLAYLAEKGTDPTIKKKDAGVDFEESAVFTFDIVAAGGIDEILAALDSGNLKIAIHVQSIGEESDSYATSIPEPTTMMLLGIGLIGIAGLGRKKLFKK